MSDYEDFFTGGGVPVGGTVPFFGGTVHKGFLKCNGAAYNRVTYAKLFAETTETVSGNTTNASAVITGITSTANLGVGKFVSGTGIPAGATILTVDSGTQITLSIACTATGAGVSLVFSAYGVGDGSTTFNVPDSRGEHLRGWDDARGVDAGRALGSAQAATRIGTIQDSRTSQQPAAETGGDVIGAGANTFLMSTYYNGNSGAVAYAVGARPRNLAVQYLIKY